MTSTRELLVGDTSFISAWARAVEQPEKPRRWPLGAMRRVESATVAINVVTVAEVRHGHWFARWGQARMSRAERWLGSFAQLSVDEGIADAWARLKATGEHRGHVFGANDLWIAATGYVRNAPIVTCDRHFLPMREFGVQVIYLPRRAAAGDER